MKQSNLNLNHNNTSCKRSSKWIATDPINYFLNFEILTCEEKNMIETSLLMVSLTNPELAHTSEALSDVVSVLTPYVSVFYTNTS